MKIYDIDQIIKDKDTGLYNLTQLTFRYVNANIRYYLYSVQKGEEMRIDLVCQSIYNSTDFIDILCNVNNIDNPLNISENQIILYPDKSDLYQLRYQEPDVTKTLQEISNPNSNTSVINPNKNSRVDKSRQDYLENQSLPPTALPKRTDPINLSGDQFIVGEGLF